MDNNIVVDSDFIQLGAGADEERSAPPTGSSMSHNIIMSQTNLDPFTIYDDMSGITFEGNVLNDDADVPLETGFSKVPYAVAENQHGLRVPAQSLIDEIEFGEVKLPVSKEDTGADFYPKVDKVASFQSGKVHSVAAGTNTILDALNNSNPGDTLILENGGEYLLTKYAFVNHPITLKTESGDKAIIRAEKPSFFVIENGGALELENLWIDGAESPDRGGNSVISTSKYSMNHNYSLAVRNSKVTNLDINHTFNFLKVFKNTFADSIEIIDTEMTNVTGSILPLNMETDDIGIYNAENVIIRNSTFTDIQGSVADVHRGGRDESTFGPIVVVEGNEFINTGLGSRNRSGASLKFLGVQKLHISDSAWNSSAPLDLHLTNGEPITVISDIVMTDTGPIKANNDEYTIRNVTYQSSE